MTRLSPCAASSAACWASSTPLVVSARSSMPSIADSSPTSPRGPGAAAARRPSGAACARLAARTGARAARSRRSTGARGGQETIAVAEGRARHAIGATEIAAVHHRDAQVRSGRPRASATACGAASGIDGVLRCQSVMRLPAIERHGEPRRMRRRARRQLDETVGAGEGDEVAGTAGRPRLRPRPSFAIVTRARPAGNR